MEVVVVMFKKSSRSKSSSSKNSSSFSLGLLRITSFFSNFEWIPSPSHSSVGLSKRVFIRGSFNADEFEKLELIKVMFS